MTTGYNDDRSDVKHMSVKITVIFNNYGRNRQKIFRLLFSTIYIFVQFNIHLYETRINKIDDSFDFETHMRIITIVDLKY